MIQTLFLSKNLLSEVSRHWRTVIKLLLFTGSKSGDFAGWGNSTVDNKDAELKNFFGILVLTSPCVMDNSVTFMNTKY